MYRKIYQELLNWKNSSIEKPLMIIGARQIGKTYIIDEFCKKEFKEYIKTEIMDKVAKKYNLNVSRRTVNKYRTLLNIQKASKRRIK